MGERVLYEFALAPTQIAYIGDESGVTKLRSYIVDAVDAEEMAGEIYPIFGDHVYYGRSHLGITIKQVKISSKKQLENATTPYGDVKVGDHVLGVILFQHQLVDGDYVGMTKKVSNWFALIAHLRDKFDGVELVSRIGEGDHVTETLDFATLQQAFADRADAAESRRKKVVKKALPKLACKTGAPKLKFKKR